MAIAFWIKPFVALPAVAVILASRSQFPSLGTWLKHSSYLIAAGVIVGVLGILWMINAGCWTYFVEMTSWNGDYYQAGRSRWSLAGAFAGSCVTILAMGANPHSGSRHQYQKSSITAVCLLSGMVPAGGVIATTLRLSPICPGVILGIAVCVRLLTEQLLRAHNAAVSQATAEASRESRSALFHVVPA